MASSARSNPWSNLSSLGFSETGNSDARAALLRVNAEMFAAAPARDRESIETFGTLVLGFLPKTDRTTLLEIARILAPCPDTPISILEYLVRHAPESQDVVLLHAPHLPFPLNAKLLATPAGRLQLASRLDLDAATIERLLVVREEAVEDNLAANRSFVPTQPAFAQLVRRAQLRPALARLLLARGDLTATDESMLYLAADQERRPLIRARLAASMSRRKAGSSRTLNAQGTALFLAACREGDVAQVEKRLTAAFGFPAATDWRMLETGRHRLLALALKALGVSRRDAARMFLTLHPALSYPLSAIKELLREMRDVPAPIAFALVQAILGVEAAAGQAARRTAQG